MQQGFQDSFCQSIFTELLLSIYFTILSRSKMSGPRKVNFNEMRKFIPRGFKATKFKINAVQYKKIDEFIYLMQDHSYGTFKNARIASLISEYIHVK